ncbi:MAG: hypothetical protein DLD55_01610 [candidate division SR1 bacterium]|nr:MAG: hypothetical protein DLD55_01610 [candidate division SR1 bacterium]
MKRNNKSSSPIDRTTSPDRSGLRYTPLYKGDTSFLFINNKKQLTQGPPLKRGMPEGQGDFYEKK